MMHSAIVCTDAEYEAAVKYARDQGYKLAAISNAGLTAGMRLTFLPASVFTNTKPPLTGKYGAPRSVLPQRTVDEFLSELPSGDDSRD